VRFDINWLTVHGCHRCVGLHYNLKGKRRLCCCANKTYDMCICSTLCKTPANSEIAWATDVFLLFFLRGDKYYGRRPTSLFETLANAKLDAVRRPAGVFNRKVDGRCPDANARITQTFRCIIACNRGLFVIMSHQKYQLEMVTIGRTLDSFDVEQS